MVFVADSKRREHPQRQTICFQRSTAPQEPPCAESFSNEGDECHLKHGRHRPHQPERNRQKLLLYDDKLLVKNGNFTVNR